MKDYDVNRVYRNIFPDTTTVPTKEQLFPTIAQGEQAWRNASEQLTRSLKSKARINPDKANFRDTARIESPIGFNGSNRIIAVAEIREGHQWRGPDGKGPVKIIMHYGTLPADFFKQWKERKGSEVTVLKAGEEDGGAVTASANDKRKTGASGEETTPDWITELNGEYVKVVYTRQTGDGLFAITVNNPVNPSCVTLFLEGKAVARLLSHEMTRKGEQWMRIEGIEIPTKYRGRGFGKQMYRVLLDHIKTKGIASYLPDRTNKKQVPKIYKALGGVVDGDWAYIPKSNIPKTAAQVKLYHGPSTSALEAIMSAGGVISAPSYWGTERIAEYYALTVAEENGGDPVVISMPLSQFKATALL